MREAIMQPQGQGPYAAGPEIPPRPRRRYRSPFWGIVLVGVGVVWLLHSTGAISDASVRMLALLWPILLVGLGIDLLLGRRSPVVGAVVGVVTVGLIVVFMAVGPSLGWAGNTKLVTETRSVPIGTATSARVSIDSGAYGAEVHALQASNVADRNLLAATVNYAGTLRFESSGDAEKVVTVETHGRGWWFGWLEGFNGKPWDIGLDPATPLALDFQTSSGSVGLDLAGLTLTSLQLGVSSGEATAKLPAGGGSPYGVDLQLSSGDLEAQVAAGAQIDMKVDISSGDASVTLGDGSDVTIDFHGSSGQFTLQVPAGQACRVEVRQVSSGDVHLPSGFVRTDGGGGKEGTWETAGYASAAHKVLFTVEISSGNVRVQQGG
jgi:hypothetical protein